MTDSSTILLVDDEDAVQKLLAYPLERDGFRVVQARDGEEALARFAQERVDLVVLEAFAEAVEGCEDATLRPVLDRLCSLYALSRVEAERGYYQEHGRISAQRSKAVIKAVNELCAAVREDARLLVDAFGVPVPALADAEPVARVLEQAA